MSTVETLEQLSTRLHALEDEKSEIEDTINEIKTRILSLQPDPVKLSFPSGLSLAVRPGATRVDAHKVEKLHPADPENPDNPDNRLYKLAVDTKQVRKLLTGAALDKVTTTSANRVEVGTK